MDLSENEKNATNSLLDFEDEVTARIEKRPEEDVPVATEPEIASEPTVIAPSEIPDEASLSVEPLAAEEPALETAPVPQEEPVPEESVPAFEEMPEPQYGAPQPLFEDLIPAGFAVDLEQRKAAEERAARVAAEAAEREAKEAEAARKKEEKEAEAARKKAEKDAAKEAKKQAKEDKKKAKTAALIAKVEAEAEVKAKKEYEKETGEPYDAPAPAPQEAPAPEATVVAAAVAPAVAETPVEAAESATASAAPKKLTKKEASEAKKITAYERKLRKKYKLDKDPLLSKNDAVPGFVIAKGENVIRSYCCLEAGKGDGILCLTNRRLLINAGERSEIDIDKVSGIKFCQYTIFSFAKFLFGLIFLGLGILMLLLPAFNSGMNIPGITGDSWKSWFTILFYICGGVSVVIGLPLLFTMVKKNFYFYIFAREETPFLEYKSRSYARREKNGKVYKYQVSKAGKESEKAARELGALIIEAKEGRYDF